MNPKSYFAIDANSMKSAAKGVQQKDQFTYDQYKSVLYDDTPIVVENRIFRPLKGEMSTVKCKKIGLTNVFIKGKILNDKITVRPYPKHIQP